MRKGRTYKKSTIEWTDYTWNFGIGCTKVNDDCLNCYMYQQSLNGTRYNPKEVRLTKTKWDMPRYLKDTDKLIFTCSLTDFFHPELDKDRHLAWEIIRERPDLTFQILTKRIDRVNFCLPDDWGDGWSNVWIGASIGSKKSMDDFYHHLQQVPTKTRFISFEPLTEAIDFDEYNDISSACAIHWAILGGESGSLWDGKKKPKPKYIARPCQLDWLVDLSNSLGSYGIPVFVKQLGTCLAKEYGTSDRHGRILEEFPVELQQQRFPYIWEDRHQFKPLFDVIRPHERRDQH